MKIHFWPINTLYTDTPQDYGGRGVVVGGRGRDQYDGAIGEGVASEEELDNLQASEEEVDKLQESAFETGKGNITDRLNLKFTFSTCFCFSGLEELIMLPKIPLMEEQIMLLEIIFCKSLATYANKIC